MDSTCHIEQEINSIEQTQNPVEQSFSDASMKKRNQKSQFSLTIEEEEICDFLQHNGIIWNIKKIDYKRVDKKTKLWSKQASRGDGDDRSTSTRVV